MGFLPGNNNTTVNSATPVTMVAAPGAAVQRMVDTLTVHNNDSVAHTVTLKVAVSGGSTYIVTSPLVQPNGDLLYDDTLVLDATTKSITVQLEGAITTTALDCTAHWADNS